VLSKKYRYILKQKGAKAAKKMHLSSLLPLRSSVQLHFAFPLFPSFASVQKHLSRATGSVSEGTPREKYTLNEAFPPHGSCLE